MRVGRPLKFESPEVLEALIDKYFDETPDMELTITGLALALDTDRVTLIRYEDREEYSNTIKRAKTRIEVSYEKSLRKNGRAGDIFGLKNFGWADKQEIEVNATVTEMPTIKRDGKELKFNIGSGAKDEPGAAETT